MRRIHPPPLPAVEAFLDRLHARARRNPLLQRLTALTRLLIAVGFIPPSIVKIQGHRFMTAVTPGNPISDFFEAMYHSGAYWRFVGWAQLAAGVLLLVPRTATLGAVLFFPIILNIFVITVALHFTGTPVVTGLMLLAAVYLLCWDYHRLKAILWEPASATAAEWAATPWSPLELAGYALGTAATMGVLLWTRGLAPRPLMLACLVLALAAAVMVLVAWAGLLRGRRVARA